MLMCILFLIPLVLMFFFFFPIVVMCSFPLLFVLFVVYWQPKWFMRCLALYYPSVLWFVKTSEKCCSLTIDDAPSDSTSAILDVLKEHDIIATFFIISSQMKGREDIMARILQEGHHVANHMTEDYASIRYTSTEFEEKLMECDVSLRALPGQKSLPVHYFRPGSGWFNFQMESTCTSYGYRIVLGSVYPHDAQIRWSALNSWYLKQRTTAGSVIIVHDRPWTIDVLKTAVPFLKKQFQFKSLKELITLQKK